MRCLECGGEMFRSLDPIQTIFKGDSLNIEGVEHWKCEHCGELEYDSADLDALDRAENRAYRELHKLLNPEDIRSIRKRYKLTQSQFELILGVAAPTVSRWETGSVVQTKVADNLMRMIGEFPEAAESMAKRVGIGLSKPKTPVTLKGDARMIRFPSWGTKTDGWKEFAAKGASRRALAAAQEGSSSENRAQRIMTTLEYLKPQDEAA